jgi:hypothetical protein
MKKLTIILPLLLIFAAGETLADANKRKPRRDISATATRNTPNGDITRRFDQRRFDNSVENGYMREMSRTGRNGATATRSSEVVRDAENGIRTRSVEGTRANGNTYSSQHVATRTEDGYSVEHNRTRADGSTSNRTSTVVRDPENGTRSRSVEGTTASGKSYSSEHTATKTADGVIVEHSRVNPDGSTSGRTMTIVNDAETGTHSRSVEGTLPNGKSYSGERVMTRTDTGRTIDSSRTGPNGQTAERHIVVERNAGEGEAE